MRIHHIGYLVKNIQQAEIQFRKLGYSKSSNLVYDSIRDINILFMTKDDYTVELVSPASKKSIVSGILKRIKNSPYHICYESDDFEQELLELSKNGYVQIDQPCPAPAIDGRRVVFLVNSAVGMIELLEK